MTSHIPYLKLFVLVASFYCLGVPLYAQAPDNGKTYVNLTKGTVGGTIEKGDVLQIRATVVITSTLDSCAFYDVIPAGTSYNTGSLKILTNEGKTFRSFTDVAEDDPGTISGSDVIINMGYNASNKPATAFRRGRIQSSDKPKVASTCVMIACYEVTVTADFGTTIEAGTGSFTYKSGSGSVNAINFPSMPILIFKNNGICANTVGGNSLGQEFNGTFGSGKPRNRGASASISGTYQFKTFTTNTPNDYYYGVANNTSTQAYSTSNSWPKPDGSSPTHRVFGVWDIIGDHTGAADPYAGNPAADTITNSNAGYMLVINASYKTDYAFQHTISNLCPNTYYELSAWFYNICSKCGADSNGVYASSGNNTYKPTGPGDSSGVRPNLTFRIDGVDYYTTGDIPYTGNWVKKGFTYLTGPNQTSFTMSIRNNAPGGGGNDWALDDISVVTCSPDLHLVPSGNSQVCLGNQVSISCDVKSYFDNFNYYKWQISRDGGVTWKDTLGTAHTGNPVPVTGGYEYTAVFPSFIGDMSQHLAQYRIRVATSEDNLAGISNSCSFANTATIVIVVDECGPVLSTKLLDFSGKLKNNYAQLQWQTTNELKPMVYVIEKSIDGTHFEVIGHVAGKGGGSARSNYMFTDPSPVNGTAYYRLQMQEEGTGNKYSKTILLSSSNILFDVRNVSNPFNNKLSFEMIAPEDGVAKVCLSDMYGRVVVSEVKKVVHGLNVMDIQNTSSLPGGGYVLQVQYKDQMINKRVVRM